MAQPILSHGTIRLDPKINEWAIQCEPHVRIRLKNVFASMHVKAGLDQWHGLRISNTDAVCRDLEWFCERYPLEISLADLKQLRAGSRRHQKRGEKMLEILAGDFQLPAVDMALPARPYQEQAAAALLNNGYLLLVDDLGLGKTVVAIRAMADKRALPALCVVDAPLTEQWAAEIRRFLPGIRVHVIRSRKLYDVDKEPGGPFHVFVISYAMLAAWEDMFMGKLACIIFDEVQELRTGHDPKEFNVSQKNMAAYHLACQTDYRLGLTATPIYNYGGELWNLVDTLAPGILGTQDEFLREWCRGNDKRKAEVRDPKALGAFLQGEGILMRRTRAQVGRELPPLTRIVHEVTPSKKKGFWKKDSAAAELARLVLDKGAKAFERMQAGAQLDVLLRQMTGVQKAPDVAAFVRMLLEQGTEKVLLYGWHREVYRIWDDLFEDYDPVWYTGSESPSKKRKDVLQFVEGDSRLLIMSLRSGRGLNRISEVCSTIVHGELDWSPGVHEQCDGRAHRDGQAQPVFSYYVVSTEGSDPIVSDVLGLKTSQIEGIRDPDGAALIERTIDPKHIQRLAESYLQKIGEHS